LKTLRNLGKMNWSSYYYFLPKKYHRMIHLAAKIDRRTSNLEEMVRKGGEGRELLPLMTRIERRFLSLLQSIVKVTSEEVENEEEVKIVKDDMQKRYEKLSEERSGAIPQMEEENIVPTKISDYITTIKAMLGSIYESFEAYYSEDVDKLGKILTQRSGIMERIKKKEKPMWMLSPKKSREKK